MTIKLSSRPERAHDRAADQSTMARHEDLGNTAIQPFAIPSTKFVSASTKVRRVASIQNRAPSSYRPDEIDHGDHPSADFARRIAEQDIDSVAGNNVRRWTYSSQFISALSNAVVKKSRTE